MSQVEGRVFLKRSLLYIGFHAISDELIKPYSFSELYRLIIPTKNGHHKLAIALHLLFFLAQRSRQCLVLWLLPWQQMLFNNSRGSKRHYRFVQEMVVLYAGATCTTRYCPSGNLRFKGIFDFVTF